MYHFHDILTPVACCLKTSLSVLPFIYIYIFPPGRDCGRCQRVGSLLGRVGQNRPGVRARGAAHGPVLPHRQRLHGISLRSSAPVRKNINEMSCQTFAILLSLPPGADREGLDLFRPQVCGQVRGGRGQRRIVFFFFFYGCCFLVCAVATQLLSESRCDQLDGDPKEVSPIFSQFLECVWQLTEQFPQVRQEYIKTPLPPLPPAPSWPRSLPRQAFEFSEWFLLQIHEHVHSCQYGNFLGNNQRQREELQWVSAAKSSLVLALQLIIGQLVQKVVAQHKDWSKCKGLAMTKQKHLRTQQKGALWL